MDIELLINVPTMSNGGSLGNEKHLLNATQPMPARQNAQNLCLSLSQRVDLSHGRDPLIERRTAVSRLRLFAPCGSYGPLVGPRQTSARQHHIRRDNSKHHGRDGRHAHVALEIGGSPS